MWPNDFAHCWPQVPGLRRAGLGGPASRTSDWLARAPGGHRVGAPPLYALGMEASRCQDEGGPWLWLLPPLGPRTFQPLWCRFPSPVLPPPHRLITGYRGWWALLLFFSRPVPSDSLRPHGLWHARPPCPSPFPSICPRSCPLHWWCHPAISSSNSLFSFWRPPSDKHRASYRQEPGPVIYKLHPGSARYVLPTLFGQE